jgi:hypothetical protein
LLAPHGTMMLHSLAERLLYFGIGLPPIPAPGGPRQQSPHRTSGLVSPPHQQTAGTSDASRGSATQRSWSQADPRCAVGGALLGRQCAFCG